MNQNDRHPWLEEANEMTIEDLPGFIQRLTEGPHNEESICLAIAAAALGAAWAMESVRPITGLQATCVMWQIIEGWELWGKGPKRMLEYREMLYPKSEPYFNTIPLGVWEWLQKEARSLIDQVEESQDPSVPIRDYKHWKSIAHGVVPFGWKVDTNLS